MAISKLQKILAGVCLAGAVSLNEGCGPNGIKFNGKSSDEIFNRLVVEDIPKIRSELHEIGERQEREYKMYEKWKTESSEELTLDQWYDREYKPNISAKPYKN